MIKPKLDFFQVQVEGVSRHTIELPQVSFGIALKGFEAIDMLGTMGKFILTVLDTKMFRIAQIN